MSSEREAWATFAKSFAKSRGGQTPAAPRKKYGSRPTQVDGITFDSQREAARFQELKLLHAAGYISEIEIHPCFPLQVVELYREGPPFVVNTIGRYAADFRYLDLRSGEWIVEDVKSPPTRTEAYALRKRIVEAVHGITIKEIE